MAEFPALPIWTDAYLADTRHLSTEEHGAYLLLLMEAWRRPCCDLPDNDTFLARAAGLSADRWEALKPAVMEFWKRDGRSATWRQKRLSAERRYVADQRQKQRDKAAKRWKPTENTDATAIPRQCRGNAPTPTPTPTPTPLKKEPPTPKGEDVRKVLLTVLSESAADDFIAHRQAKRAKLTERAAQLIVGKLEGHHAPDDVVSLSIQNGWTGVFPDQVRAPTGPPINGSENPSLDSLFAAAKAKMQ